MICLQTFQTFLATNSFQSPKRLICIANSTLASTNGNETRKSSTEEEGPQTVQIHYEGHVPISFVQRAILSVGSSIAALMDPRRADMVAVNGEATGHYALRRMHQKMLDDPEGREILACKPRINSKTVDLDKLRTYPEGTLARAYTAFLDKYKVSPDTRLPVKFVDHPELAYVMQRYRETHDLVHAVLGMPTNMLGEVAVKWVEAMQTGLPMCVGGAVFGPLRFKPKQRQKYVDIYLPWALRVGSNSRFYMNIFFERRWDQNLEELRKEFNIEAPPSTL